MYGEYEQLNLDFPILDIRSKFFWAESLRVNKIVLRYVTMPGENHRLSRQSLTSKHDRYVLEPSDKAAELPMLHDSAQFNSNMFYNGVSQWGIGTYNTDKYHHVI